MKPPAAGQPAVSGYYGTFEFDAMLGGSGVRVVSKAGLPHLGELSAATRLLSEAVAAPAGRILVIGGGQGALAVALARHARVGWIDVLDVHAGVLAMAERTLLANHVDNAAVLGSASVLPEAAEHYDIVVLETPPNRGLARRWLVEAYGALRVDGMLYLAGANHEGIQSIVADAGALFGNIAQLGFKAKNRVARARKSGAPAQPDWAATPGIAPGTFGTAGILIDDLPGPWYTLPGVFAHDRLDPGTALLLDHLDITAGEQVLDAGCGLGILGIAAAHRGAGHVDLIDVNLLAVAATARNLVATSTSHARVLVSDGMQAVAAERYDQIVSNPPFHSGKGITFDVAHIFVAHGRQLLRKGGRIVVVANRFLAYDDVLRQFYRRVERRAQTSSFQVLVGET